MRWRPLHGWKSYREVLKLRPERAKELRVPLEAFGIEVPEAK